MVDVLCSVVVGREAELGALRAARERAQAGQGGLVVLTGEAGIGKSRLGREALSDAEANGMLCAVGRAVPTGAATAYGPLTEAMMQVLRARAAPADLNLATWLTQVAGITPMAADPQGEVSPAARAETVIHALRTLGGPSGVLVVLEDLHWSDPDTLAVLEYLAGNLSRERILCVVTSRSEAPSAGLELFRRLRGRPGIVHLPLARLDSDEVARMVQACLPAATEPLLVRVQEGAEGIPLLVEELLASPGVPRSFADSVTARLADFNADERVVLEAAALLGRRFDWHLLPDASGLSSEVVIGAMERAVGRLLILADGDSFRFRHALTRDAVIEAMLPPRRVGLAGRALAVIDAMEPARRHACREVAADLAAQAGDTERAGTLLTESGRASVARGALTTAIETLRRASAFLTDNPDRLDETEQLLVEALSLAGRVDEAIQVGRRLIGRLDKGDPVRAAELHLQLAHAAVSAARWPVAVTHLEAATELLAGARPDLGARIAVLEAEVALAADDVERSRQLATTALETRGATPDVRCHALELIGRYERLSDIGAARLTFEQALSVAEENGLAFWRLRALHELGTIEMFESAGTRHLDEARRSAQELGALSTMAVLDLQLAVTRGALFSLDAGAAHARESLELAERLGLDVVRSKAMYLLAENFAYRRDRDEMERYLALALASSAGDPAAEGFAWGARGMLAFVEDDWDGAVEALGRAAGVFSELPHAEPANFRSLWPVLLAAAGDRRARVELDAARRVGVDRAFGNRGTLAYAEAVLVGPRQPAKATELALAADADLVVVGPWGHFPRLCAAAPALADRWGEPRRWLKAASDCFAAFGLDRLEGRCARLLAPPAADPWQRLGVTTRESEVLNLVAEGLSNKDIASRLQVSPRTVEKHLESLLRKTGVSSRTQLAVAAARGIEGGAR